MTHDELANECGNGIATDAIKHGYTPKFICSNGMPGDAELCLWDCDGARVISTNGDPVWEDSDPEGFAALMEEIND